MGFFDKIANFGEKLIEQGEKEYGRQLDRAYKEISQKEKSVTSKEQLEKLNAAKERIQRQKELNGNLSKGFRNARNIVSSLSTSSASGRSYSSTKTYGGKTIDEWDTKWTYIGPLKTCSLTPYNRCVGLYRMVIRGETKYVGRATELNNGGFRKRLSDYRRQSDSARKHKSGSTINKHINEIDVHILVVGNDQEAVSVTKALEGPFIARYNPEWNKQINI